MNTKITAVIGATTNPSRYAYRAAHMLKDHGHPVIPIGIKKGEVAGEPILNLREQPEVAELDTVTLYLGPQNQSEWEEYIINLQPKRVVFNPGTENAPFAFKLEEKGIEAIEACTLVMLSVGTY
ncbi:MAG: CoA-binding protein [Cyclobacteriaceae bacterium]